MRTRATAPFGRGTASPGDQDATRHNPFVYFEAKTSSPECQRNVVDFTQLVRDLGAAATTPNLSYYSLLATIEDIFALPRLGYAGARGLNSFGPDVFNAAH
ncbi:hypothetical protein [Arthrobacter sp. PM3]|uniref:hypothetical protein n=1 Tax=Arthrobacter sp. PM3 TaxID=2017685 RepID=UPI0021C419D2|nr:hypothetical protein [Arthrobacter sp. PM3]